MFWIRCDKDGESRREAKLVTVAEGDPNFQEVQDLEQLPEHLLAELENFFDVYKMLEPGTSPAPTATRAARPPCVGSKPPGTGRPAARPD